MWGKENTVRKIFGLVLVVMFFLPCLLMARYYPSTAEGWYYWTIGDQVAMLQADQLGMVRRGDELRAIDGLHRVSDDLIFRNDGVAGVRHDGRFYPAFDGDNVLGEPRIITMREKIKNAAFWGTFGAGLGAVAGDLFGHRGRGAALGAAGGAGASVIKDSFHNRKVRVFLLQAERARPGQTFREQLPSASNRTDELSPGVAEFELTNGSPATIEVFDGEKFLFRMRPGEVRKVTAPQEQYTARALVPNNRGGISRGDLETHSTNSGWAFEEPAVARR